MIDSSEMIQNKLNEMQNRLQPTKDLFNCSKFVIFNNSHKLAYERTEIVAKSLKDQCAMVAQANDHYNNYLARLNATAKAKINQNLTKQQLSNSFDGLFNNNDVTKLAYLQEIKDTNKFAKYQDQENEAQLFTFDVIGDKCNNGSKYIYIHNLYEMDLDKIGYYNDKEIFIFNKAPTQDEVLRVFYDKLFKRYSCIFRQQIAILILSAKNEQEFNDLIDTFVNVFFNDIESKDEFFYLLKPDNPITKQNIDIDLSFLYRDDHINTKHAYISLLLMNDYESSKVIKQLINEHTKSSDQNIKEIFSSIFCQIAEEEILGMKKQPLVTQSKAKEEGGLEVEFRPVMNFNSIQNRAKELGLIGEQQETISQSEYGKSTEIKYSKDDNDQSIEQVVQSNSNSTIETPQSESIDNQPEYDKSIQVTQFQLKDDSVYIAQIVAIVERLKLMIKNLVNSFQKAWSKFTYGTQDTDKKQIKI